MELKELIRNNFDQLSKGQKGVANYLMEDMLNFSLSTASQIAKQINVSETTVIRLSYALGFDSFTEMQKYIKKSLVAKGEASEQISNLREESDNRNWLEAHLDKDIEILNKLKRTVDIEQVDKISTQIMEAEDVRVVGFRASFASAYWLYLKLGVMRSNVQLISHTSSAYPDELFIEPTRKTVFIILSFPSYVGETLAIAHFAKTEGATVIAISDSALSPVARIADEILLTDINVDSENMITISSVLSLLNILTSRIERQHAKVIQKRAGKLKEIYKSKSYFLE